MCFCGTSRACPEFSFTEEDIKKFVCKLKIATKRLVAYAFHDSGSGEEKLNQNLGNIR
jgi:hypothetical protein